MRAKGWGIGLVLSGLSALWLASPLWAAENCAKDKAGASAQTSKSKSTASTSAGTKSSSSKHELKAAKDPVVVAFTLPRGVELNDKQQRAYTKLKRDNEKAYRAAVDKTTRTTDPEEKRKAAKEAHELRGKIDSGMQNILAIPVVDAQKEAIKEAKDLYRARHGIYYYGSSGSSGGGSRCPCGK